jgi:hypothetical protein
MNKADPSPFLEYSDGTFGVANVWGVKYVRGTPDDGGLILIDNSGNNGVEGGVVSAIENRYEIGGDDAGADALSPVGISLIAIGTRMAWTRSTKGAETIRGWAWTPAH